MTEDLYVVNVCAATVAFAVLTDEKCVSLASSAC